MTGGLTDAPARIGGPSGGGGSGTDPDIDLGEFTPDQDAGEDDSTTSLRDRTGGPIGSGSVDIDVDSDTGEATETISGANRGDATEDAATDPDDIDVTEVDATGDADEVEDRVESTEQAVENATDGAAFGDPGEVEDVGDGEATTTVDPSTDPTGSSVVGSISTGAVLVALLVAAVAYGGDF